MGTTTLSRLLEYWGNYVLGFSGTYAKVWGVVCIIVIVLGGVSVIAHKGRAQQEDQLYQQDRIRWTKEWADFKQRHSCRLIGIQVGSVNELGTAGSKGRIHYRSNPSDTWLCQGFHISVRSGFVPTGDEQIRLERLIKESNSR